MDLTFNTSSARTLLAILMGVDKQQHGIPIVFIMFTAKKDAKAVHADYNKELLKKLLGIYKEKMGRNAAGQQINFCVVITDNDLWECFALTAHWDAFAMLCMFHTWQSFCNGLNRYLKVIPKGEYCQKIHVHLAKLLHLLIRKITLYDDALKAYNDECDYYIMLSK